MTDEKTFEELVKAVETTPAFWPIGVGCVLTGANLCDIGGAMVLRAVLDEDILKDPGESTQEKAEAAWKKAHEAGTPRLTLHFISSHALKGFIDSLKILHAHMVENESVSPDKSRMN